MLHAARAHTQGLTGGGRVRLTAWCRPRRRGCQPPFQGQNCTCRDPWAQRLGQDAQFGGGPSKPPRKIAPAATHGRSASDKMRNFAGAPVESGARTRAGSGQAWMDHERPNFFSGPYIERRAEEREDPDWIGAARADPATRYLIGQGTRQLLRGQPEPHVAFLANDAPLVCAAAPAQLVLLGWYEGARGSRSCGRSLPCWAPPTRGCSPTRGHSPSGAPARATAARAALRRTPPT